MNKKRIKRCKVCGAEYEACYSCEKINSWRVHTDTAEHYYVFCTLMDYRGGRDAKACYQALRRRGIDFADVSVFTPEVQKTLDEIYAKSHGGKTLYAKKTAPNDNPKEPSANLDVKAVLERENGGQPAAE